VSTVFVETYGHSIDEKQITLWNSLPGAEKLSVILRLSTLKKDRYRFLYGEDLFEPAMAAVVHLEKAANRKFAAYVEMLKIKEVEDEITPFFDRFENSTVRVILNKYNRYIDLLPERRVTDLTPLDRSFCWHIARDFYLKPDGTVPLCKQDIVGRAATHDFAKKTILEILSATARAHSHSVRGEHDSVGMPCLNCDEWYTFNG
ncbi:MAG TPA: spiro-SPASM protein, partial [Leptospiraceae bacterium]|nr:spiro-SPASM protein [Leptospiraceae bacterium]